MSAPLSQQIDGLRVLARNLSARHLMRSGAVGRESEASHLVMMLKDAVDTLERIERGEDVT